MGSKAARALAKRRKPEAFVCEVCGREFQAIPQKAPNVPRTCSTAHRSKLWRRARREQPDG